jgi:formylglycine-generating enzyme required for sulfatase activity
LGVVVLLCALLVWISYAWFGPLKGKTGRIEGGGEIGQSRHAVERVLSKAQQHAERDRLLDRLAREPEIRIEVEDQLTKLGFSKVITGLGEKWLYPGAGEPFKDCDGCPDMLVVAPGELIMVDQSHVKIDHPPAAGRTEVTYDQWNYCRIAKRCRELTDDANFGRGNRPVINVDWHDAQAFVKWLSDHTTKPYRLLSELEWEYLASAGSVWPGEAEKSLICHFGNIADLTTKGNKDLSDIARAECYDNSGLRTMEVGSYKPNPWGFYDTIGNASEWVEDCSANIRVLAALRGRPAGPGQPADCGLRAVRGGSWRNSPQASLPVFRLFSRPTARDNGVGFRVARDMR